MRRGSDEVLVWASVWDTEDDAEEFVRAATEAYRRRYPGAEREVSVTLEAAARPWVRIVDASPGTGAMAAHLGVEVTER